MTRKEKYRELKSAGYGRKHAKRLSHLGDKTVMRLGTYMNRRLKTGFSYEASMGVVDGAIVLVMSMNIVDRILMSQHHMLTGLQGTGPEFKRDDLGFLNESAIKSKDPELY